MYSRMCARGTGHLRRIAYCASISRLKRSYALTTLASHHSHDALIIDALIAGRRFLPLHINHIPTLPHYTLTVFTRAKPQIQLHNGKIKNFHNGNSTKSNRMQFI